MVKAVWFYARAWNFAPAGFKARSRRSWSTGTRSITAEWMGWTPSRPRPRPRCFRREPLVITPADTPAEKIHKILANTPDLNTLALADKELVLAFGAKDDADKLWALLKDSRRRSREW